MNARSTTRVAQGRTLFGAALASAYLAVCAPHCLAQARPDALEKMVAYRRRLATGVVELRRTYTIRGGALDGQARTLFKSVQLAGDHRQIHTLRGDQDGIVLRSITGGPAPVGGHSPRHLLYCAAEYWSRSEDSPIAERFAASERQCEDFRTLGAASTFANGDIDDVVWKDNVQSPMVRQYEEWREGDLDVVRLRCSGSVRTYWLDPSRGWSPIRVREESKDGQWAESRSTFELMDGVWFPRSVYFFSSRYRAGKEPTDVIEVDSAEFNRPEHASSFTPGDIGVDVGTYVFDYDSNLQGTSARWDGQRVVSHEEYSSRRAAGEIRDGAKYTALVQRLGRAESEPPQPGTEAQTARAAPAPGKGGSDSALTVERALAAARRAPGQPSSLWEEYVRAFIQKYQLNEEQSQKAFGILRQCQEDAHRYLAKRKPDLERLEQRKAALPSIPEKERAAQQAGTQKEFAELIKPIDEILENQLKPRLEKLPTRAQRQAAEERGKAASRPAHPAQLPEASKTP